MLPEVVTPVPGPRSRSLAERLKRFESRNVTFVSDGFPIFWDRASGVNVWDADGNRFLDLTSGFAVAGLGHGHPGVVEAGVAQAGRLFHAMGDVHPCEGKADLCQLLSEITFGRWTGGVGKSVLCSSGSEAVEAALKTALLHSGKPGVISFVGGYHGLGHGALETAGIPAFRDPFASQLGRFGARVEFPSCYRCPFGRREGFRLEGRPFPNCCNPCLASIRARIEEILSKREIGAILVEPVQGRGGEVIPPRDFLPMLREICDSHKILLVLDEIFTGFNRTGRLFACEHSGVVPDIVCVGKGLTSGFPMSACVGRSDVMDSWPESAGEALHTSTFLGHPVGCAMAVASIREHVRPETAETVRRASGDLIRALERLRDAEAVGDIRGIGLMAGVELVAPGGDPDPALASAVVQTALRDGIVLLAGSPNGNVLSLCPPFGISPDEIEFVAAKLYEYATSLPGSIS